MINPVIPLLVIPFLNSLNQTNNQNYTMPSIQNIQEIIEILERINRVSNNMNKAYSRNSGRDSKNNINIRAGSNNSGGNPNRNESYEEDLISKLRNFLNKLNGD